MALESQQKDRLAALEANQKEAFAKIEAEMGKAFDAIQAQQKAYAGIESELRSRQGSLDQQLSGS